MTCFGLTGGVVVVVVVVVAVVVVGTDVVEVVDADVVVVGVVEAETGAAGAPAQPVSDNKTITASTGLRTSLTLPHAIATTLEGNRREGTVMQPGGGMPDMQQILQQAQAMQEQLMSAQEELANAEATGSAGGGLVTAVVSGTGELKSVTIDPKVVDPEDVETLADLIVAAVRDAGGKANKLASEAMGPLAGGLGGGGLGLPGM
jgi:nucleoid-associated protein EbfC